MPTPLDLEKQPQGGPVNQPSSGSYGAKAAVDRLKKSLPTSGMTPPAPEAPGTISSEPVVPVPNRPGRPAGPTAPPGTPPVLMHPTQRPEVPVSSPLGATPPAPTPALTPQQDRLSFLQALANSPRVHPNTREWAQSVLEVLMGGQGHPLG
jgi:hypothetical protein